MPLSSFEKENIVITGGSGFIGTALLEKLRRVACKITLVGRSPRFDLPQSDGMARIQYICADLTKEDAWSEILLHADYLFHLSAQTNLYFAEKHPLQDEKDNITPIRQLAEYAASGECSQLKVVLASTVTIVGNNHKNPVDETFTDNPISVYDRHKQSAEYLLAKSVASGHLRGCSLRLSNVYGYGADSRNENRGILNIMMKRAVKGEALTIYGNGSHVRDFVHISDVTEAFLRAASCKRTDDGRYFIIASEKGHTQREAFEMISREAESILGRKIPVVEIPEPDGLHPIEKRNFVGNCNLFRCATGWRQNTSLRDGIRSDLVKLSATRGGWV